MLDQSLAVKGLLDQSLAVKGLLDQTLGVKEMLDQNVGIKMPKKSWIDIAEWTSKSFAETQALAHNRQEWRELMRKSVMTCPYGSSRS